MRPLFNLMSMDTTNTWSSTTTHGPVTILEHNYPKRPSWKSHGKGRAVVEMRLAPDWDNIDLRCSELPEQGRVREVYVYVPIAGVVQLLEKNGYRITPP